MLVWSHKQMFKTKQVMYARINITAGGVVVFGEPLASAGSVVDHCAACSRFADATDPLDEESHVGQF